MYYTSQREHVAPPPPPPPPTPAPPPPHQVYQSLQDLPGPALQHLLVNHLVLLSVSASNWVNTPTRQHTPHKPAQADSCASLSTRPARTACSVAVCCWGKRASEQVHACGSASCHLKKPRCCIRSHDGDGCIAEMQASAGVGATVQLPCAASATAPPQLLWQSIVTQRAFAVVLCCADLPRLQ
jgi:hypothetical protein